jgi:hypothetical protein
MLVAGIALAGMLLTWYPLTYFEASGGDRLLLILVGVDVVAGPILTLIIFKAGKKGLKFDLTAISVFQVIALLYGLHVMWNARPVFVVFAVDRFNLVFANQIPQSELDAANHPDFNSLSWNGPKVAAARLPKDSEALTDLLLLTGELGRDVETMPSYFVPITEMLDDVLAAGFELDETLPEPIRLQAQQLRKGGDGDMNDLIGLPLLARGNTRTLVIERDNGHPVGMLNHDPWLVNPEKTE